jgi:hypothetical protein
MDSFLQFIFSNSPIYFLQFSNLFSPNFVYFIFWIDQKWGELSNQLAAPSMRWLNIQFDFLLHKLKRPKPYRNFGHPVIQWRKKFPESFCYVIIVLSFMEIVMILFSVPSYETVFPRFLFFLFPDYSLGFYIILSYSASLLCIHIYILVIGRSLWYNSWAIRLNVEWVSKRFWTYILIPILFQFHEKFSKLSIFF